MLKYKFLLLLTLITILSPIIAKAQACLDLMTSGCINPGCENNPVEPLDGTANNWFYMHEMWVKNTCDKPWYVLIECDWESPSGVRYYPNFCYWLDPGIELYIRDGGVGMYITESGTWKLQSCAVYRSDYSDCSYYYTPQDDEIDVYGAKTWNVAPAPTTTTTTVVTTTVVTTTTTTTTVPVTYDITDCVKITSAGTYTLVNNITATLFPDNRQCAGACCIEIASNDVTINLNNHRIEDSADTLYGVYAGSLSNVIVQGPGEIIYFDTSIRYDDVNGGYIKNILSNINDYSCFKLTGVNTQNIQIDNNVCYGDEYGIEGRFCWDNCRIHHNIIWDADVGIYLSGKKYTVDNNKLGYWEGGETGIEPPCTRTEYQLYQGVWCDFCTDTTIKENYMNIWDGYGPAIKFTDHAENVKTWFNELELDPAETVPGEYDSSTVNNVWCDNRIVKWFLEIGETCIWTQYGENSASYVLDYGTGNSIAPYCTEECVPGYHCRDESTLVYLASDCSIQQEWLCEYGCAEGECIGERLPPVPTTAPVGPPPEWETEYNITSEMWFRPVVNATQLIQANATWLIPFFTPFFLSILGMMTISGILAYLAKSSVVFPLSILIFALVFGVIGIIPSWIAAIIVIIAGFLVGLIMKGMITT